MNEGRRRRAIRVGASLLLGAGIAIGAWAGRGALRAGIRAIAGSAASVTSDLRRARGASRRPFIGVGAVGNNSGVRGNDLGNVGREALTRALGERSEITLDATTPALRSSRAVASGHWFDANIQSIEPRGTGVRVAVSIVVSTYPGRQYEFESATAITLTGGSAATPQAQDDAVRTAMSSAANGAVNQILSMH